MCSKVKWLALASTLVLGLSLASLPAHAYYWGYPLYGYGPWGSSMWPLRAVLYPLRGYGYGYNYGPALGYNAAYWASSLLGGALYRPLRYPRPYMDTQYYQDEEPLYEPRRRSRPKRPVLDTTDQVAQARWDHAGNNAPAPLAAPSARQAPSPLPGGNAPLAHGFVDLVNSKFNGDISRAMFDPEARSWAQALGLIRHDQVFDMNLSSERVDLIERLLKDRSLPAPAKIDSVRTLLQN